MTETNQPEPRAPGKANTPRDERLLDTEQLRAVRYQAMADAVDPKRLPLYRGLANTERRLLDHIDALVTQLAAAEARAAQRSWWALAWAIHEHVTAERSIDRSMLPYFGALELCGEAGELANLLKKDWRADSGDRTEAVAMELADVAIVTSFLARDLGVDLEDAILRKIDILLERWPGVKARMHGPLTPPAAPSRAEGEGD